VNPRRAADLLRTARKGRRTLRPFTDEHPELDEDWGYAVQALAREDSVAAGDPVVGAKLGLTSRAKQQRMGVDRPIVGFLARSMLLRPEDVGAALETWVQPRIEPEIAFVTARTVDRALGTDEVAASIATVNVAAEIIDSRWADYRFRLPDVVADDTSAAGVLLGSDPVPWSAALDLASARCELEVDGDVVHRATGAAILGDPLRALQLLSEHLERHRQSLPAGSLVLAGALTDAVPLDAGSRYRLSVEGLGSITTAPVSRSAPRTGPSRPAAPPR
jgi:2-oxo-3-hexenedioate decarboxylase